MTSLYEDDSGLDILDKMPSLDLLTVIILAFNSYLLYSQLDYYNRENLLSLTSDPYIIGLQVTLALILVYIIEFIHDRKSGSNRH